MSAMMLEPIAVLPKPPEIDDTSTDPCWIQATDNRTYVVKKNPPQEANSNFNEYLASKLCMHVGITTLEPYIMRITQDFISGTLALQERNFTEGNYFATLYHPSAQPICGISDPMIITNLDEVSDFIVFDIFIHNRDRNCGNILVIPNSNFNSSRSKYFLIDHGLCFNMACENNTLKLPYVLSQIPCNTDEVTPNKLRAMADKMCDFITTGTIMSIYNDMGDWVRSNPHATTIQNELTIRTSDNIIECISRNNRNLMSGQ